MIKKWLKKKDKEMEFFKKNMIKKKLEDKEWFRFLFMFF
jgi:hypothetical protein